MLTLDLVPEEDISAPIQPEQGEESFKADLDKSAPQPDSVCQQTNTESTKSPVNSVAVGKGQGLPQKIKITWDQQRATEQAHSPEQGKKQTPAQKSRCVSMDEISSSDLRAVNGATIISPGATPPLTISQLQDLISKKLQRTQELLAEVRGKQQHKDKDSSNEKRVESSHAEAERLLQEAVTAWSHARDVLEEVQQIQALSQQLNSTTVSNLTLSQNGKQKNQVTKGRVWCDSGMNNIRDHCYSIEQDKKNNNSRHGWGCVFSFFYDSLSSLSTLCWNAWTWMHTSLPISMVWCALNFLLSMHSQTGGWEVDPCCNLLSSVDFALFDVKNFRSLDCTIKTGHLMPRTANKNKTWHPAHDVMQQIFLCTHCLVFFCDGIQWQLVMGGWCDGYLFRNVGLRITPLGRHSEWASCKTLWSMLCYALEEFHNYLTATPHREA